MSKFCHNCGKPQSTSGAKFCAHCGTNLLSLSAAPPTAAQPFTPFTVGGGDDAPEEIDSEGYWAKVRALRRQMSGFDVEISKPQNAGADKLGIIAQTMPPELIAAQSRGEGPFANLTPEQAKKQFAEEAGSRVNNTRSHSINVDE
jgi:hypothetical protein